MQHILLQIRLIYAVKMFFFYRRLRPDLHSASHFHFQVHICITFTKPNNFPVSSQSSIHNFFIENVTDSFFFVFYLIFNQSCIYIYLPLCPLNPVCADFSPRINDDSTHIIRPNKDPDSIFMKSTDPDLTNFARLLENKK